MRIIHVAPRYHPHIGGVEYVVKSVAERLAKMGHTVTVIAGEPNTDKPHEEEINGVEIIRWPTWSPGNAYHIPRQRSKLREFLTDLVKEADVVHAHNIHAIFSIYALEVVKNANVRIVMTPYYHGTGHTLVRKILWSYWRSHVRKLLNAVDIVHTVSKLEASLVRRDFARDAIVIENGVEENIRNVKWEPEDYVMYSGRIEKYKNIHLLAKIVKALNEKYGLNLRLKVFGNGPYKERLTKILEKMNIAFEINDFMPFEKYVHALSHAVIFGLLSRMESYPQSINEANAIGVPVIVAKPWGSNFEGRTRTLIIDTRWDLETITEKTYELIKKAPAEEPNKVPTWTEVTNEYINKLYTKKQ